MILDIAEGVPLAIEYHISWSRYTIAQIIIVSRCRNWCGGSSAFFRSFRRGYLRSHRPHTSPKEIADDWCQSSHRAWIVLQGGLGSDTTRKDDRVHPAECGEYEIFAVFRGDSGCR